jgi:hypothetical protein
MSEVPLYARGLRLLLCEGTPYWGTSLTRKRNPLGPYRRSMPRVLGGS